MEISTIGFTKWRARGFFDALRRRGIRRLVDVRIHPDSQLAGFAKQRDLSFFLAELAGAEYVHEPLLAPTEDLLRKYRKKAISWAEYESEFNALLRERQVELHLDRERFRTPSVLLCSEHTAEHCHRRLVAEYLRKKWGDLMIVHLDMSTAGGPGADDRDALHGELAPERSAAVPRGDTA